MLIFMNAFTDVVGVVIAGFSFSFSLGTAGPIKGQPPLRDKNSTQFMNGHVTHLKMSGLLT